MIIKTICTKCYRQIENDYYNVCSQCCVMADLEIIRSEYNYIIEREVEIIKLLKA